MGNVQAVKPLRFCVQLCRSCTVHISPPGGSKVQQTNDTAEASFSCNNGALKSLTTEMEANFFCSGSENVQKHINTEILLKSPDRYVVDGTNVTLRNGRKQKERVGEGRVSLLSMAVSVSGGWRNRGGLKEKQEGRKGAGEEGGSRFVVVKKEDNGGKGRWLERKEGSWQGVVRGVKACTRLSAPGVPCGPGSSVREGG